MEEEKRQQTLAEQQIYLVDERVFMQKSLPPLDESTPDPQLQISAESNNNTAKESSPPERCDLCTNRKHVTASIISLAALVAVIIVMAVLLAHDGFSSGTKSLASTLSNAMKVDGEFWPELGRKYCGNVIGDNVNQEGICLTNNGGEWTSIKYESNEWNAISSALHDEGSSPLAVSPTYIVPQHACTFSLNSPADNSVADRTIQLVAAVSLDTSETLQSSNLTLNSTDRIRLIVRQETADSFGPIVLTFHGCVDYTPVSGNMRRKSEEASFRLVQHHQHDRCSFELYEGGQVHCDWWMVSSARDPAVGEFERAESSDSELCLQRGLESNPASDKYFMKFSGHNASAYLVSPLFAADVSRQLTFSFHYSLVCDGSELRAYIVPRNFDLFAAVSETAPFWRVSGAHLNWEFQINSTTIPDHFAQFHVLLEAVSSGNGSCGDTDWCHLPPTIAVDEILLEMNSPKCPATDNESHPIDTAFEDDVSNGWVVADRICGLAEEQTTGNGPNHMLLCTLYQSDEEYMLRSSLLRANSNCSCTVHFRYAIPSRYMFPVFLTQKFGNDTTQYEAKQKILWSAKLPTGGWQEAIVNLKLVENGEAFLLEFNEIGMNVFEHHFRLDDLRFENCDFSVVAPGNNS